VRAAGFSARGPFKGKRVEFASTAGIERFDIVAEDFMRNIFGFEAGEYLITDLSSVTSWALMTWSLWTSSRESGTSTDWTNGGRRKHDELSCGVLERVASVIQC
jgi:hypothetical protein